MSLSHENIRAQVTVAAIMRNEEALVGEFLDNLPKGVPAIIYDDCSTDETASIARERGASVISGSPDVTGFAEKRNRVLAAVQTDWAFHLDADERCPDQTLVAAINAIVSNPSIDAISFPVQGYFLKRKMYGRAWKRKSTRLARVSRSRWEGVIHEKLVCDGKVYPIGDPLHHYGDEEYLRRARKSLQYNILEVSRLTHDPSFLSVCIRPFWEFFKYYVLQYGWADGKPGIIFAFHVWGSWFQRLAIAYTRPRPQDQS